MAAVGFVRAVPGGRRITTALAVSVTAVIAVTGCGYPVASKPACADAVLKDWTNGSLGAEYAQDCYYAAIEALPEDLRSYTSAAEDIERAATEANRADGPVALRRGESSARRLSDARMSPGVATSADGLRAFPLAVGLLGVALVVLGVGGVAASVLRRRRQR
jgi:hypothetical protein